MKVPSEVAVQRPGFYMGEGHRALCNQNAPAADAWVVVEERRSSVLSVVLLTASVSKTTPKPSGLTQAPFDDMHGFLGQEFRRAQWGWLFSAP